MAALTVTIGIDPRYISYATQWVLPKNQKLETPEPAPETGIESAKHFSPRLTAVALTPIPASIVMYILGYQDLKHSLAVISIYLTFCYLAMRILSPYAKAIIAKQKIGMRRQTLCIYLAVLVPIALIICGYAIGAVRSTDMYVVKTSTGDFITDRVIPIERGLAARTGNGFVLVPWAEFKSATTAPVNLCSRMPAAIARYCISLDSYLTSK
jgi:hypothetical protein